MSQKRNGLKWTSDRYWQTAGYNARLFTMFKNQVLNMALTRYHWINLPQTCDERFLELTLYTQGIATIARPRSGTHANQWLSLTMGGWESAPDMYGNPSKWRALGLNGYSFNVNTSNGYYCWDNHLRAPLNDRVDLWCRELVDIVRTMQQNRVHQKTPMIISGVQEKRLDMTNLAKQVGGGELIVLATDGIQDMHVQALTTNVPFIGTELWANYLNIWTQIYGALGIGNLPFKAERQIEDEVNSQQDPTNLIALDGLTERRRMCDYLNTHFTDFIEKPLDVVWRSDNETANYNITHNLQKLFELDNGDDTDDTAL